MALRSCAAPAVISLFVSYALTLVRNRLPSIASRRPSMAMPTSSSATVNPASRLRASVMEHDIVEHCSLIVFPYRHAHGVGVRFTGHGAAAVERGSRHLAGRDPDEAVCHAGAAAAGRAALAPVFAAEPDAHYGNLAAGRRVQPLARFRGAGRLQARGLQSHRAEHSDCQDGNRHEQLDEGESGRGAPHLTVTAPAGLTLT